MDAVLSKRESRGMKRERWREPWTVTGAIARGSWYTRLSMVIMGFGNLYHRQITKGLLFLGMELLYIWYMIDRGIQDLMLLPSLGWLEQVETWNEAKGVYEYTAGHQSVLILLFGVVTVAMSVSMFFVWRANMKSAYKAEILAGRGEKPATIREDWHKLTDSKIHNLLLTVPILGILVFTILPLIFMMAMAFTSYSKEGSHLVLFDWIGLQNFGQVLNRSTVIGQTFWPVLGWTVVWAVLATFLNYILGILLALVINRKRTRGKSFWRFIFSLTIAIPQFVSLLIIRTMLQPQGAFNILLQELGLTSGPLPFMTDPTWARVTVIVINLWVGIPYTLLQVTGILQNIPQEYYEAARIDGANRGQIFAKITMPYVFFITQPYLITQFTSNVNNFNVIYLLSGGGPPRPNSTAGYTDLLVTWLYKLTIDQQYYNIGAVIGILTFLVLSVVALISFQTSRSYRSEGEFQ